MMIMNRSLKQRGFTLIELIIVIVLIGVIAASVTVFIKPAMDSYTNIQSRANMSDQVDTALRRMLRDVRRAVPNSLTVPVADKCFVVVPATSGGRYRMGPDLGNESASCSSGGSASCAAWVDTSQTTTAFDVLSTMSTAPNDNDWVVINNQNASDVYTGANTRQVTVSTPATTQGTVRLTLSSSLQVSPGYTGGRFQTISNSEQTVSYICSGTGASVNGNGPGTLYRMPGPFGTTFGNAYPSGCPALTGLAVVLATNVESCNFVYVTNQGSNQQSGYMWMNLKITRNYESSKLVIGAHVMNVP
jgi:MSHA biogenesis protein MshO